MMTTMTMTMMMTVMLVLEIKLSTMFAWLILCQLSALRDPFLKELKKLSLSTKQTSGRTLPALQMMPSFLICHCKPPTDVQILCPF